MRRITFQPMRAFVRWESLLIILILIAGIWSTGLSPVFLTSGNLLGLLSPYAFEFVLGFGLMFVMILGEIDISVCSTMAASAALFARLLEADVNVWVATAACVGAGVVLGAINGYLVSYVDLPSLAVTLGTLAAYRGLAYVILGGDVGANFPAAFVHIGGGYIGTQLPVSLLVLVGLAVVLGIILHTTRYGRTLYATGASREVARSAGLRVRRIRMSAFVISGGMAGIAAVLYLGYFGSVQADAASGTELLSVITVVVLGGVSIFGGSGTMIGVALGCILVAEISNGTQLANFSQTLQEVVIGVVLLVALMVGNALSAASASSRVLRRLRPSRFARTPTTGSESPIQPTTGSESPIQPRNSGDSHLEEHSQESINDARS